MKTQSCIFDFKPRFARLAFAPSIVSRPRHDVLDVTDPSEVARESVEPKAKSTMGHTAVAA